jgi:RNA polymerase sigma factor (TIGR02999 family)
VSATRRAGASDPSDPGPPEGPTSVNAEAPGIGSPPRSRDPLVEALLLDQVRRGDPGALGRLFTLVYDKLREIAHVQRRGQPSGETLSTTALVHEAFIKLFGSESRDFNDRAHFMAVAATAMRQILIGNARQKSAAKRGGGQRPATFEEVERALATEPGFVTPKADALLALDRALERLQQYSERQSRIVECRFFGGMSIEETAVALGVSPATVKRDWSIAQAWLHREIQRDLG